MNFAQPWTSLREEHLAVMSLYTSSYLSHINLLREFCREVIQRYVVSMSFDVLTLFPLSIFLISVCLKGSARWREGTSGCTTD